MSWSLQFDPLLPLFAIVAVVALLALVSLIGIVSSSRGALIRGLAALALVGTLFNPNLRQEDRETVDATVAVIVDKSGSQVLAGRDSLAEQAAEEIVATLERLPGLKPKRVDVGDDPNGETGTRLFAGIEQAFESTPLDEIAGSILITDGLAHDIPEKLDQLELSAPVHGLITGRADELDRRVILEKSPRYGIVGEVQEIIFRVDDEGSADPDNRSLIDVIVARDGETLFVERVAAGQPQSIDVELTHAGESVITLEAAPLEGEITPLNNRAVLSIEGVRENLRVLLVSGEPHSGERTWRNLLKSDASVDLVHFTILRPPEKQDGTPINQLSLIAFPTRELFSEKIEDFDLIIFDRYQRRGVLPLIYFDNIARYVENGGAVLIASGPEYGTARSLYRTPLASILPAAPTGSTIEEPFHPQLTGEGERHPVTRALPGSASEPPAWSRWFRVVQAASSEGNTLMNAGELGPLLVLNRLGEGRVALMLSDHAWLWARGYEGGGPHVPLLRRLSHWLMAEPDLEEERITLRRAGDRLVVERQTMQEAVESVEITVPDGSVETVELATASPGLWRASMDLQGAGLYRAQSGQVRTLASIGPANPREWESVISTTARLEDLASATGGSVQRIQGGSPPRILPISSGRNYEGRGWLGVKASEKYIVTGVSSLSLLGGFLGLAILLGLVGATWYREGR